MNLNQITQRTKLRILSFISGFFFGFSLIISMIPMVALGVISGLFGGLIGIAFGISMSEKKVLPNHVITLLILCIMTWLFGFGVSNSVERLFFWFASLLIFCIILTAIAVRSGGEKA